MEIDYGRLTQHELEKRIVRMALTWVDLLSAGFAFETLIEHPSYNDLLSADRDALVEAAVIAYARPFSHSEGLGAEWPDFADDRWTREHEELLEYRNAFVGHSDTDPRTVTIETDDSARGFSYRVTLPVYRYGRAEMALEMCRGLHTRLNEHLNQAIGELIRREREGGPPEALVSIKLPR